MICSNALCTFGHVCNTCWVPAKRPHPWQDLWGHSLWTLGGGTLACGGLRAEPPKHDLCLGQGHTQSPHMVPA